MTSPNLLKPMQPELFRTIVFSASKMKSFLLVTPGFCQVAVLLKVLQVKKQDVNRPYCFGILGGYRLRHSFILNKAVLVCTELLLGQQLAFVFLERLTNILTNTAVRRGFFFFPCIDYASLCFHVMQLIKLFSHEFCCCISALETWCKGSRANKAVLCSSIFESVSPSLLCELHVFSLNV